jgi:hypothetical protein
MKTTLTATLILAAFASAASEPDESSVTFQPYSGVVVNLTASKSKIEYDLTTLDEPKRRTLIALEVETQPHVEISDFNFDGYKDFSVWYLDEGMGQYSIHRVFIYQPKSRSFLEALPRCGEEFLNLRINKAKKSLTSTYYSNNRPLNCSTRKLPL